MSERVELHRIRLDVLLWTLGGFEARPAERRRPRYYTDAQIEEIARIAAKPRSDHCEILYLSQRWQRSCGSLRSIICRRRRDLREARAA